MKWAASVCKSEIKLPFSPPRHFFFPPASHKKFAPRWLGRGRPDHAGDEQSVVGVPSIFHSDEDGAEEAIGGGGGGGGVRWQGGDLGNVPSPKLRWQQWQGSMLHRSIPLMQAASLTTHVGCICVCVCVWLCVCVWCSVQYVRLLTRSWRLSVKPDSWWQAGVNTWHRARRRRGESLHAYVDWKRQNESTGGDNVCEADGGGNHRVREMFYWQFDAFA